MLTCVYTLAKPIGRNMLGQQMPTMGEGSFGWLHREKNLSPFPTQDLPQLDEVVLLGCVMFQGSGFATRAY